MFLISHAKSAPDALTLLFRTALKPRAFLFFSNVNLGWDGWEWTKIFNKLARHVRLEFVVNRPFYLFLLSVNCQSLTRKTRNISQGFPWSFKAFCYPDSTFLRWAEQMSPFEMWLKLLNRELSLAICRLVAIHPFSTLKWLDLSLNCWRLDILSAVNDGDSKHHCLGFLFLWVDLLN